MIQQALLSACRSPLMQFQRYRGKINIQRPRQPHYERARVVAVTMPQLPKPSKTKDCFTSVQERLKLTSEIENPYNDIIAREVYNWLQHSRMVAIFHLNPITQNELFPVRVQLHKYNMSLKSYGKKIITKAVQGTRFETIVSLFDSNHCIVFSPEAHVTQLLRITRKVPQMILLAGIVDDTLLSRNEFMAYAQLQAGGIQTARAELAQTLNMAGSTLVRQLESHQNNLVNILDVHAKGASDSGESNTDETKTTA